MSNPKKDGEWLCNRFSKEEAFAEIEKESFERKTISFYRYVKIENPEALRDDLFREWAGLGCLGRIYVAPEGINAQMNVPLPAWENFVAKLYARPEFKDVPFKVAVESAKESFWKLAIKVKKKIVADGLSDPTFDPSDTGDYLDADGFNKMIDSGAVVVDMRNHYESEVGRFENAICPDADTFREELEIVEKEIIPNSDNKDKPIIMYCTGGIRCEKASAFMKHHGCKRVYHLKGGIIDYAHQVEEQGLENKFKGVNFVFDNRVAERISDDVIANCHQCGNACDHHVNCENLACHLLFIQCEACKTKHGGEYCCDTCAEFDALPEEQKRALRKGPKKDDCLGVYKSRLRPKINKSN